MPPECPIASPRAEAWGPLLARAVTGEGVSAVYQPIVDLQRLAVVGYEALARFAGPPGLTPDRWFAAAAAAPTSKPPRSMWRSPDARRSRTTASSR